jgi:MAP/microtubule affinity-regulating kinase
MAPEIIQNKGYSGFCADIWSFGVFLYILVFGKVPFRGNNLPELNRNIIACVLDE